MFLLKQTGTRRVCVVQILNLTYSSKLSRKEVRTTSTLHISLERPKFFFQLKNVHNLFPQLYVDISYFCGQTTREQRLRRF
jgi:hypothetical protein